MKPHEFWNSKYSEINTYCQAHLVKTIDDLKREINLQEAVTNKLIRADCMSSNPKIIPIRDNYDFIIIDCPPSLNMLTVNAMTTADSILVPIQCEYYALEGISQLIHTIDLVQERLNSNLRIDGVVFTMYDARTNLSSDVVDTVKENLNATVYQTIIPRNVRLAEAPSHGLPINLYDSKSSGAESYRNLAKEIIERKDV